MSIINKFVESLHFPLIYILNPASKTLNTLDKNYKSSTVKSTYLSNFDKSIYGKQADAFQY